MGLPLPTALTQAGKWPARDAGHITVCACVCVCVCVCVCGVLPHSFMAGTTLPFLAAKESAKSA
jgi:hypothetical protein